MGADYFFRMFLKNRMSSVSFSQPVCCHFQSDSVLTKGISTPCTVFTFTEQAADDPLARFLLV
jgi:hypothetical protein